MGKNVFEMIRDFGGRARIFAVQSRNVTGPLPHFVETLPDDGYMDMYQVMKTLREAEFNGAAEPDHVPHLAGDSGLLCGDGLLHGVYAGVATAGKRGGGVARGSRFTAEPPETRRRVEKNPMFFSAACFAAIRLGAGFCVVPGSAGRGADFWRRAGPASGSGKSTIGWEGRPAQNGGGLPPTAACAPRDGSRSR